MTKRPITKRNASALSLPPSASSSLKDSNESKPMLEFRNIHFGYRKLNQANAASGNNDQSNILAGVSFAVPPDGMMALLGPSGSGKTTVLRLALGLEKPDSGEIYINQKLVSNNKFVLPPEKRGLGLLFQDIALFPHMTVYDNIGFGLKNGDGKNKRLTALDKKNLIMGLLQQIGLPDFADRYPHQLSGGEQQRVALARALAPGSKLILMDEPFSSLNERIRDDLRDWVLRFLKENNITALMVTHSVEEAMFMSDSMAVLHDKKLQQQGSPQELYYNPKDRFVAALFGKVNHLKGKMTSGKITTALGKNFDKDFDKNFGGDFGKPLTQTTIKGKPYRDGQMVDVIIRADAIKLVKGDNKKTDNAPHKKPDGTITNIHFLGHHLLIDWRCDAATDDTMPLHSLIDTDHFNPSHFAIGDKVHATLDTKGVFIFPAA